MREEAEVDFKKAVIHAPSRGVIISDDVQKDDFVQVGKSLLVFEDTSAIEVRCDLRSDQLQSVLDSAGEATDGGDPFSLPPLEARIRYEGNGHVFEWAGVLDRYDGLGLNEKTRTAPCRILVRNTKSLSGNRTLVRGMYVSVQLNLGKQEDLLALPAEAIKAGNVVWLVEQDKLQERVVRVVNRMSDSEGREMAIIQAGTAGLSRGLKAIVSPIPQPTIGMPLRSRNVTDPADSGKATGSGEPQKDEPDASSSSESGGNTVRSATTTSRKIGRQG